jgi:hypothetical protein
MRGPIRAVTTSRVARIAAVAAIALGSVFALTGTSAAQDKTIRTLGTEDVHINSKISRTCGSARGARRSAAVTSSR